MLKSKIELHKVSVSYRKKGKAKLKILSDLTFVLNKAGVYSILGPSGIGKTTIFKVISGLIKPDSGFVVVNKNKESRRSVDTELGYVFQEPRLVDWMNVYENIDLVLLGRIANNRLRAMTVKRILNEINIKNLAYKYPSELSGGEKQLVCIARALSIDPRIILLDEPLNSLDNTTAMKIRRLLLSYVKKHKITMLFITHNILEAVYMSNRIYVTHGQPVSALRKIQVDNSSHVTEYLEQLMYDKKIKRLYKKLASMIGTE